MARVCWADIFRYLIEARTDSITVYVLMGWLHVCARIVPAHCDIQLTVKLRTLVAWTCWNVHKGLVLKFGQRSPKDVILNGSVTRLEFSLGSSF